MALKLNEAIRSAILDYLNTNYLTAIRLIIGTAPVYPDAWVSGDVIVTIPTIAWDAADKGTAVLSAIYDDDSDGEYATYGRIGDTGTNYIDGSAGVDQDLEHFHFDADEYAYGVSAYFSATTAVYPGE